MDAITETNIETTTEPTVTDPVIETTTPDAAASEPAEWSPNYKVKAYDKEYEIPEKFRSFISKENEKDFKDTFEKVYALDEMKAKNAKIRAENDTFRTQIEKEFSPVVGTFKKLEKFIANNDFDSFFANIPAFSGKEGEVKLQQWMLRKLQEKDLPPEQQALYNDHRAAQQRAYALEEENNSYKQKFEALTQSQQQAAINETLTNLDNLVAKPEIETIAKAFDSRLGQDGSYKMEVLRNAATLATKLKRDVSIEEAVEHFNKMMGFNAEAVTQDADDEPQALPVKKPTLPSLNGKATSPVAQKIKSIDDLKRLRSQMIATESRRSRE